MTPPEPEPEDPPELTLSFTPLEPVHFGLLRDWLNRPHVYEWWGSEASADGIGGPGQQAATVEDVARDYLPEIEARGPAHHHLIVLDGTPIGLVQWYPVACDPRYAAEIGEEEPGTAGVDLLIGELEHVGRGIGPHTIRRYVEDVVFADPAMVRCVGAPDVRNRRSIRAFEKAGFRFVRDADVTGEPAPEHVMVVERDTGGRPTIRP